MKKTNAQQAKIGDTALKAKTGKTWAEWFKILDAAGARQMGHREIADYLYKKQGVPGWWAQMVTVGYKQARGIREKHQKPDGYEVSANKTLAVPLAKLFLAWENQKLRGRWLKDAGFEVRKATKNKSMRVTWVDGKTSLDVNFYSKGDGKSLVAVQHGKLPDSKAAAHMKSYWSAQLDHLKTAIER